MKTDTPKEFLKSHLGMYFITNVSYNNITNNNIKKHMKYINPYKTDKISDIYDGITLPSPELLYMLDIGITFNIVCGAWTYKPFHFKFSKEMHEKSKTGPRYYQMIVGEWGAFRPKDVICMNGTKDWCSDLKSKGYDVQYFSNPTGKEGTIQCTFTKDLNRISHKSHLAAFICSYQRIQLFQQLEKIQFEDTYAIITDEIVIKKSASFKINEGFREKNSTTQIPFACASRLLSLTQYKITFPDQNAKIMTFNHNGINRYMWGTSNDSYKCDIDEGLRIHIGQGGTGKTYINNNDKGYLRYIYLAPSQQLRQDKQNEHPDIKTDVWHNMTNYPGIQNHIHSKSSATMCIDEASCLSKEQLDQFQLLYPYSSIILCGDISRNGYIHQLPTFNGEKIPLPKMIIEHTKNRRAKDDKLKELLLWYRKRSISDKIENHKIFNKDLIKEMKTRIKTINHQQLQQQYSNDDYVLTGRHCAVDKWTKLLRKDKNGNKRYKFLVTKNNVKGLYNGTIIKHNIKPTKSIVERHAFTCHQIQGSTIKNSKIFIDINNLFDDVRMIYVAISRAEYIDQIRIIC